MNTDLIRDLVGLMVLSMLAVLVPAIADHGVEHMTVAEWWTVADAGLVGVGEWAIAYLTPITRRYGVGAVRN